MSYIFLIDIVIFLVLLFVKKYKFEKNELINIIFLGVISTFVSLIFSGVVKIFVPNLNNTFRLGFPVIYFFLTAGLPEEISKFLMIKLTKPKTKNNIFVNAIFISLIFTTIENVLYYSTYEMSPLFRLLAPGHLTFQLFMILFLIKAYDFKQNNNSGLYYLFNIFALIVPAIIHSFYDVFSNISIFWILSLIGILTYLVIIVFILRMNNENVIIENKKISTFSIVKIIITVLLCLFLAFASVPSSKYNALNKEVNIKEEDIYMTVVDFEEFNRNESFLSKYNGTYTKIKIKVRNATNKEKNIVYFSFSLYDGDKKVDSSNIISDSDKLPSVVPPKSEIEGYLYFVGAYKDTYYLTYTTSNTADNESNKYYFSIKK